MKNKDKVKKFWQERAKGEIKESEVTHRDIWQRWLEIETIKRFLKKDSCVIDIGCGNGYTTLKISSLVKEILAMDYSNQMIKRANADLFKLPEKVFGKVKFEVGDVLKLNSSKYGMFDIAISERCLINLESWADQKKAIVNIAKVLKAGGIFIFIEGCKDGRNRLNSFREKVGLSPMPPVWHNVDFEEKKLFKYLKKYFTVEEKLHFGIYDFIARVVHPLVVSPREPKYRSKINKIAAQLALKSQEFDSLSRVLFLVLKKKRD